MKDEKRRKVMMGIVLVIVAMLVIGVVAWMWERSYYKDEPFTFSQLVLILLIIPAVALLFAMFVNPSKKRGVASTGEQVVATFPEAFTTVVIPWQGRPAIAVRAPSVPLDQMKGEGNDFTPAELVINVEVVDANDEHTVLTDFDPPLELEFKFPPSLIKNARERATRQKTAVNSADDLASVIKVGFWNGARWVLFTKEKHNYRIQGNDNTGYVGKVDLKKWGDPPIAWDPPK